MYENLNMIAIGSESVRPVFYLEDYIGLNLSNVEIAEDIIKRAEKELVKKDLTKFRIKNNSIYDWDYVKDNIRLCIQRKSEEKILKKDFLDLEIYARVVLSESYRVCSSFKIVPEMWENWGKNEDEIFEAAWQNTLPTLCLDKMCGMLIASNQSRVNGAIAMLDNENLKNLANIFNSNLVIIPSSIHEIIISPLFNGNISDFNDMVNEVNNTALSPEEILSNHAYIFEKDTGKITY